MDDVEALDWVLRELIDLVARHLQAERQGWAQRVDVRARTNAIETEIHAAALPVSSANQDHALAAAETALYAAFDIARKSLTRPADEDNAQHLVNLVVKDARERPLDDIWDAEKQSIDLFGKVSGLVQRYEVDTEDFVELTVALIRWAATMSA